MLVRVGNEFIQGTTAAGTPRTRDSDTIHPQHGNTSSRNSPKGELIITYQPKLITTPSRVGN